MRKAVLTRRALCGLFGSVLTPAWGFPQKAEESQPAAGEIISRLSGYMSEAGDRELPPQVVEKTKQIVLDTLAAMISSSQLPPGRFAIRFARDYGGPPVATVAASDVVCGPAEAALVNGMLAHADETDDTHPPSQSHPGCSIVPAALASAERFGAGGLRFLRAVALGYDVGTRVTITLGRLPYMVETHRSTHAISGNFGSAAAAGCLARLGSRQMRWLLSYAAQQASGLASWQRDTEHVEKAFDFGGMAARNGVTAGLLVQAGATGVEDIFSGRDNLWEAFAPKNDPSLVVEQLGERYEITRTNVKKWSVGAPIQAPLDALDNLQKRWKFGPEQVTRVVTRVATGEAAIVNNREIPDICLQHLMAVMLVDGTVTFQSAHALERMQDPAILRQRAKIELVPDDALERLLPRREAVVEVTLADGRTVNERVGTVRGTAENPMSRQEIIAKATGLIAPVLGREQSQKLIAAIFELERVNNIRDLRPLLQKA
jgi:2-methylcitrate dehydratase PrpD